MLNKIMFSLSVYTIFSSSSNSHLDTIGSYVALSADHYSKYALVVAKQVTIDVGMLYSPAFKISQYALRLGQILFVFNWTPRRIKFPGSERKEVTLDFSHFAYYVVLYQGTSAFESCRNNSKDPETRKFENFYQSQHCWA